MLKQLSLLPVLALSACVPSESHSTIPDAASAHIHLPPGFSVIEQHPKHYFIRLASPHPASVHTIRAIAASVDGAFDRIDFCLDAAHGRGDEYASVIDGKLYDYDNDIISPLK